MTDNNCKHKNTEKRGFDLFCKDCGTEVCDCDEIDETHDRENHRYDHDW